MNLKTPSSMNYFKTTLRFMLIVSASNAPFEKRCSCSQPSYIVLRYFIPFYELCYIWSVLAKWLLCFTFSQFSLKYVCLCVCFVVGVVADVVFFIIVVVFVCVVSGVVLVVLCEPKASAKATWPILLIYSQN